ncbi:LysE family transporter [Pseudomonas cichorii]|uniref:LysE family transporter n=1 Tax=Pseudomonas cichorii TaxID=36746 RepID=A0A3M4LMU8_PSECI|nr:LysE family translocator [Pseudomonas cichorii]RMQ42802.1 LysE family transporter [Pseudomonas cichorii]
MLSFLLFAFVSSITPGPTNILVLSNSARYGLRASLPIILGACMGAAGLVLAVGTGVGRSLVQIPGAQTVMSIIGVTWLTWLAWKIFSATASPLEQDDKQQRLGFIGAAGLQLVNPKTWMMALAVVSVFSQGTVADLALVFFLVSIPCMTCWALLGSGSARLLTSAQAMQRLNRAMAVLLLVSAWAGFLR